MSEIDLRRVQRRRKQTVLAFLVAALVLILMTHSPARSESWRHELVDIAGAGAIVACILGRTWSSIYIGGRKSTRLVRIGPYSVVRNPLYVFSVVGAAGVGFTTGSLLLGLSLAAITFAIFHIVILSEETFLRAEFGGDFAAYAATVPRWLPRLSGWQDAEWVRTRPLNILTTFRDSCLFLVAIPIFELIEYLQDTGLLPVLLLLP